MKSLFGMKIRRITLGLNNLVSASPVKLGDAVKLMVDALYY